MLSRSISPEDQAHLLAKDMPGHGSASGTIARPDRAARWTFRLLAVLLVAALITLISGTATFGDRLQATAWQTRFAELEFKKNLAKQSYGAHAEKVLESYGSDEKFQMLLLKHGEHVVPVIAFFMETDLASMRIKYGLFKLWEYLKQSWPWHGAGKTKELPSFKEYSPYERGLYAIDRALSEGHDFLGQFDIHEQKARWNQTQRFSEAVSAFLLSGIQTVETKRNQGEHITAWDWANAGSDVLIVFSAAKLAKLPKGLPSVSQAKTRVSGMGKATLGSGALGSKVFSYSVRAGTLYLVATHPSLLTGLLVDIAQQLNLPVSLVVFTGWFVVIFLLSFLLLPLLAALSWLIPLIKLISAAASWMQPAPRLVPARKRAQH